MKAYIIKEEDIELLRAKIKEDPTIGRMPDEAEKRIHDQARRFFNYRIEVWIDSITK